MINLTSAIRNLYTTFGKYTTEGIHHCDCGCIKEEDVIKLNSKSLTNLEEEDLVAYHGKALYTWGDVEHYKHYLPRICELRSIHRSIAFVNLDEIFSKLTFANWTTWDDDERQSLKDYILADWIDFINVKKSDIGDSELAEYGKFIEMKELITLWDISGSANALRNFVYFFYYHGYTILNGGLKLNDKRCSAEFIPFIQRVDLIGKLESEYFLQETIDEDYSYKISVVLQMIEQELKIMNKI